MDHRDLDSASVYHDPGHPCSHRPLRAFYLDVYDEDTDDLRHAFFGVVRDDGRGMAQGMTGRGTHIFGDVRAFADRLGGEIVWM